MKAWTVMVYLAGDNNLDPNGTEDLMEMKRVGSNANLNAVAQFDSESDAHQTKRYLLTKNARLAGDVVDTLGNTNTGDPKNLVSFATWAITHYPAERYCLVLWNHGQGWDDTDIFAGQRGRDARRPRSRPVAHALFKTSVVRVAQATAGGGAGLVPRAILIDDDAKDFLDNLEMKSVCEAIHAKLGRKLDLLGMDACLMSMPEVGYQMRDSVDFTVGSEETEPLDGWPYEEILQRLSKTPAMTGGALGQVVVEEYLASYKGKGEAVTQSLCDLGQAGALAASVKILAAALKAGVKDASVRSAIRDARDRVQSYTTRENVDLADLCTLIQGGTVSAPIKTACAGVVKALDGFVVTSGYLGAPMRNSKGAAIYFPTVSVSPLYAGLDFVKETGWENFLKAYLTAIRAR